MATCPKCEKPINRPSTQSIELGQPFAKITWKGIKYCCPYCNCVLNVAIDAAVLKSHIVSGILRGLPVTHL
jgi:hypothetical protein